MLLHHANYGISQLHHRQEYDNVDNQFLHEAMLSSDYRP